MLGRHRYSARASRRRSVDPSLRTSRTSYGSTCPDGTSMPGEPSGIPGTVRPFAAGFSFSSRLMSSAGTWPSHEVTADFSGMARALAVRNADALLDRPQVVDVVSLHGEIPPAGDAEPTACSSRSFRSCTRRFGRGWRPVRRGAPGPASGPCLCGSSGRSRSGEGPIVRPMAPARRAIVKAR